MLLLFLLLTAASSKTTVFDGHAGSHQSTATAFANTALLNTTLASLVPGDILIIPNQTFTMMGGIFSSWVRLGDDPN
jgi:hypothetical protein